MNKYIIDVFGCDEPSALVEGSVLTLEREKNIRLILSGDEDFILNELKKYSFDRDRLEIMDAKEIVTNNESPITAIKTKPDSSLIKAMTRLRDDSSVVGLISAGSTGAVLCSAIFVVGKAEGIARPAIAAILPSKKGMFCLVDCGANSDCKPEQLVQFAKLGDNYMKNVMGVSAPRVALLSNGKEDKKGNALTHETFELLKTTDLNFIGNMEAKDALSGDYDVITCDGFSGNILLKSIEGTAKFTGGLIFEKIKSNLPEGTDLGAVLGKAFKEVFSLLDFNSMGGAVLLGVKKPIIKAHGSANAETVYNTVLQLKKMSESNYGSMLKNCV